MGQHIRASFDAPDHQIVSLDRLGARSVLFKMFDPIRGSYAADQDPVWMLNARFAGNSLT